MAFIQSRIRRVEINEVVVDQADIFQSNGFDRVTSLIYNQVQVKLFKDNVLQPCTVVDGTGVTDPLVYAGSVYFNEIPGATGYYNIRWRPFGIGYWRLVLTYSSVAQTLLLDYDVFSNATATTESGLRASFSKP